jgi:predicted O-methyltransferase YrrM
MRTTDIRKKLEELGHPVSSLSLGDFDYIGEFTAKKNRDPSSQLYREKGCFFRPNYERGMLIYALVRKHSVRSYLEIGFGRGYSAVCAAKAMTDAGLEGTITVVDPVLDEGQISRMSQVFPAAWLSRIRYAKGESAVVLPQIKERFDMVYIDGDHRYEAVKGDWAACREMFDRVALFDDYHLPSRAGQADIECARAIDEITDFEKELITMDRRIFHDDRGLTDDQIDYGQVLIEREPAPLPGTCADW